MSAELRHRTSFSIRELDYELPSELIAQSPPARREDARLLVVERAANELLDRGILDLPDLLRPGDLLVLNDAKVLPAKFLARRATGGVVGGLFLEEENPQVWRVLLKGSRRLRVGERLLLDSRDDQPIAIELIDRVGEGQWRVRVQAGGNAEEILDRIGQAPLPHYIHRSGYGEPIAEVDRQRYQTVYARTPGAVAAPTAGFHLTGPILDRIRARGVEIAAITLHVGLGTFKPIMVDDLAHHGMHLERYEVSDAAARAVDDCRRRGGRIIGVGTTTVRVLESLPSGPLSAARGFTDLLIYPPYEFGLVDALLTNFHLPRSTLLALVMAFAGADRFRQAYAHAIAQRYRFYSYGDAMLIV